MTHKGLATVLGMLLSASFALRSDEGEDTRKELYEQGLKKYHLGQYDEASRDLEAFLAQNPSADEVLRRLNESSTMSLVEMSQNDKLKGLAVRILRIPEGERRSMRLDDARTLELVRDVERRQYAKDGKTLHATWDAQQKLRLVGAPAVPFMIEDLGDKNEDLLRSVVFVTICNMGQEAVLPLIKALKHPNPILKANCVAALGQIKDARALPAIKALHDSTQENDVLVKESCRKAIMAITGQGPDAIPEARLLYLKQAGDYLRKRGEVMRKIEDELYLVWSFDVSKNSLVRTEVPGYIWNLEMAEDACYSALQCPGELPDEEILPVLTLAYFSQLEKIDNLIRTAKAQNADAAPFEAHRKELRKADMFGRIFGEETLHDALKIALKDNDASLAKRINLALVEVSASLESTSAQGGRP
ncbi:MAG: HEAT repeat domain-containing protein [Planctomycetota bacterium]